MSTNFLVDAELHFHTADELDKAVQPLRDGGWGGWLLDTNQIAPEDGEALAGDGMICINDNVLILPPDLYINIGSYLHDIIMLSSKGYLNLSCNDGDLYFSVFLNGRWLHANDENEITQFVSSCFFKDSILLDEDEFRLKYCSVNNEHLEIDKINLDDDYYYIDIRHKAFTTAVTNAAACLSSEPMALRFLNDQLLAKAIHARGSIAA